MNTAPIKRNENLRWLSKDHHFGLLAVWKINNGIKKGIAPDRIKRYALHFWDNHLQYHFYEEETLLFNLKSDDKISEALQQHDSIKGMIKNLHASVKYELLLLQQFAEKLEKHIRYEERVLFPHLEEILTSKELKIVGLALQKSYTAAFKDDYEDEFWLPSK